MSTRKPMTTSIRRMTRPDTIWYHPHMRPTPWRELKAAFVSVGGLTVARAILLGWSTNPDTAANPVNVLLSHLENRF